MELATEQALLKENGRFYTPEILADFLASKLISAKEISVLDPAYGEGSLLLAAEKSFKKINGNSSQLHLFGCDTKPLNGLLKHLPEANLRKLDFFDYPDEKKHDIILTNPPYVRHHLQDIDNIEKYRMNHKGLNIVSVSADLWVYFIIKSVSHLKKGGCIGAVLPWAFLQADYAQPLRVWLSQTFGEIKLLALRNKYFVNADERVVLVWLRNYGEACKDVQIGFAKEIMESVSYSKISLDEWKADRVLSNGTKEVNSIIATCKDKFSFVEFQNYATIRIGVVTGANNYFIASPEKAKALQIKKRNLLPILTNAKEFPEFIKNGPKNLNRLIFIKKKDYPLYRSFIGKGIAKKYHLREHSKGRTPWYQVKLGIVPDAFFPYRITKIPYLIKNSSKIQSNNSVHRVYFNSLSDSEFKWIFVSMLSIYSQLSIEMHAKTYGRGILKIEPKTLKKMLVIKKNDMVINSIYEKILLLLSNGEKLSAVKIATEFINSELNIPAELFIRAEIAFNNLQSMRLGK